MVWIRTKSSIACRHYDGLRAPNRQTLLDDSADVHLATIDSGETGT